MHGFGPSKNVTYTISACSKLRSTGFGYLAKYFKNAKTPQFIFAYTSYNSFSLPFPSSHLPTIHTQIWSGGERRKVGGMVIFTSRLVLRPGGNPFLDTRDPVFGVESHCIRTQRQQEIQNTTDLTRSPWLGSHSQERKGHAPKATPPSYDDPLLKRSFPDGIWGGIQRRME